MTMESALTRDYVPGDIDDTPDSSDIEAGRAVWCEHQSMARDPFPAGFICTRQRGHLHSHAGGIGPVIIATWTGDFDLNVWGEEMPDFTGEDCVMECGQCGGKFPDRFPAGRCPFEFWHADEQAMGIIAGAVGDMIWGERS